jgi:deazaflavin-dependent oxidoreductase (nitroreductase family)
VVLQFFPDGNSMIVVAANDGGDACPGWYFNLTASSDARAEVKGMTIAVRAEELPVDDAAAWWERIVGLSPAYERYRRATSRAFPIIRLMPATSPRPE